MYSPFAEVLNHALKDLLNIQVDGLPEFKAHIVIGHYFCSYFLSIFDPTSLHIPYPTFPPYVYPCYVYSLMLFTLTNRRQRLQFDWYDQTPNNSSTGLPTFQNSPVVVPLHPDPALEPPPTGGEGAWKPTKTS